MSDDIQIQPETKKQLGIITIDNSDPEKIAINIDIDRELLNKELKSIAVDALKSTVGFLRR